MRLSSFHIDGFGALAGLGEQSLAPGLVTVLGPNEAGKSTLFDFLAGVLFGFPNRKDNPRFHLPVRSPHHGGRVGFVDEGGGHWLVERMAGPSRSLDIRMPDGGVGSESDLARALAGANAGLFRAVFAVDLDDLRQIDNLESDEVREMLFAASIFGQRQSATAAIRQLAEMRDGLARPRRDDATANRLARELEVVRAELAAARRDANGYGEMRLELSLIESQVADIRAQLQAVGARQRELELLSHCWRPYNQAAVAGDAFATLPPRDAAVLPHDSEIRQLESDLSGHEERAAKLADLNRSGDAISAGIERRLAVLGPGWTEDLAAEATEPAILSDQVRDWRERIRVAQVATSSAVAVSSHAESVLAAARADEPFPRDAAASTSDLRDLRTIQAQSAAVSELRERQAEIERLELDGLAAGREDASPADGRPHPSWPLAALLLAAALVVGVLASTALARGETVTGILAGLAALLLAAAGMIGHLTARRHPAKLPRREVDLSPSDPRRLLLERERARVAALALTAGLAVPPSRVDVERRATALQAEADLTRRADERAAKIAEASRTVHRAGRVHESAAAALADEQAGFQAWCESHGFALASTPDEALEAIAVLAEVRERLAGSRRVEAESRSLDTALRAFDHRYLTLVRALDSADAEQSHTRADNTETVRVHLARLLARLDEAVVTEGRRAAFEKERCTAEALIAEAFGGGEKALRLRAELATGEVLSWESELADLEESMRSLEEAEETAVRRHQSLAEALDGLARSDRIVELEQQRAQLAAELDAALTKYLVVGSAKLLLQRTLSRHERERQPAVIAKAAAHFERVTAGRYTGLLADPGPDGRQAIRVLSSTGELIDAAKLSRGTIEQLYLCLRLGLADSFAERSLSLPIVLDDVLVNFDPDRARALATELAASARTHQIVFMTCHPHLAELVLRAASEGPTESQLIELGRVA
jgi:uncharacterized protein YhaN